VVREQASLVLDAAEAARRMLEARERGQGVVCLLVLEGPAEGCRRVVVEGGEVAGALGSDALEEALDALGADLLEGRVPAGRRGREAGVHGVELPAERQRVEVYVELYRPPAGLVVVGAGHLALPLTWLGRLLGYRVTVLDDRPDFARTERFPDADRVLRVSFDDPFAEVRVGSATHVLLVTRGHRYDYECLRRLLGLERPPGYIGMIGSRRRVRATFHQLLEDGVPVEEMERIRAPVGLDLGGETPEEIAVAVAAELVLVRRGGSGRPLTDVEGVARRFFGGGRASETGAAPDASTTDEEDATP
jgi:xanthine dehydrogenase accessory factor